LALAVANIDEIIRIIRESRDPAEARAGLMSRDWPAMDTAPLIALIADPRSAIREDGTIRMTEEQARAILDLRLQRLTGLAREELTKEAQEIAETIQELLTILASRELIRGIIRDELIEVKSAFAKPRRTEIIEADLEIDDESLIAREDMVVTVTHGGYVKRTTLATYRTQRRGGKGRSGMATKEEDFITRLFVANTHQPVLFFSSGGMVYKEKIWRLPEGAPQSKGKALVNMLPLEKGETITSIMALPEDEALWETLDVMFATKSGGVRRNKLSDFVQVNRNGKIAMKPDEGDSIVDVQMCTEHDDILLTTGRAQCIRFPVPEVRVFQGRTSTGVRGITLAEGDDVIGMSVLRHVDAEPAETRGYLRHAAAMRRATGDDVGEPLVEVVESDEPETGEAALSPERIADLGAREQFVLTISDSGLGKRASAYEYRVTGRGGKGIVAHRIADSASRLAGSFPVDDEDELLLVSDAGQLIRCPVSEIRIAARATQGVTLIRIDEGERVVAVERLIDLNGDRE
jgi:DNA gyrase subunit A